MKKFVPLRNFIFDRLYNPNGGYFCRKDMQVGELSAPIDFKALLGFDDYQEQLVQKYPKNAWLTPSEIFKPYYGMSLGNYIVQAETKHIQRQNPKLAHQIAPINFKSPIRIVEAGAGTGSNAESILYYFQNNEQDLFKNMQYTIVEISPVLCKHIEKKLKKVFPRMLERGQIRILNQDIRNYTLKQRSYLIFLEVFDNLPHDKVIISKDPSTGLVTRKYSTVDLSTLEEKYEDIEKDHIVKKCMELYEKYDKFVKKDIKKQQSGFLNKIANQILSKYYKPALQNSEIFLPTYSMQLIQSIQKNLPQSHLIISDFDGLISTIKGRNAPIVSYKGEKSSDKQDFQTYLVNRGAADIFFPIDFQFLSFMLQELTGKKSDVVKSYEFFEEFDIDGWVQTASGFNPLKQDFSNTSFLVSKI